MFQVKDAMRPQVNVPLGPGGLHVRDRYGEEVRRESAGRGGTEGIKDVGGPLWVLGKGSCSCLHPTMMLLHVRGEGTFRRAWLVVSECWDSSLGGLGPGWGAARVLVKGWCLMSGVP